MSVSTKCYNHLNISTNIIMSMEKQKKNDFGIDFDDDILFSPELNPKLPSLDEEIYNLNTLEQDEGILEDLEE